MVNQKQFPECIQKSRGCSKNEDREIYHCAHCQAAYISFTCDGSESPAKITPAAAAIHAPGLTNQFGVGTKSVGA
jgi:hypothetical protein